MASRRNIEGQRVSRRTLSTTLSSAAAEWLLMLLLFLDGFFSYLVTKFARYSKLQIPCLFCSRLDHVFGLERPGFYKDLVCHDHKLEISSFAFCHVHQKLADVRDMCEACLLSFATEKKSNSETYRSLVGKLERNNVNGEDAHQRLPVDADGLEVKFQGEDVVQAPLPKKDRILDSPRARFCSCCHELFSKKSHVQRLLQTKSVGAEVELDVALFGQDGHDCFQSQGGSCKNWEKSSRSLASSHIENHSFGPLSHIGYTELKVTSDSESDVQLSDNGDGSVPIERSDLKEDPLSLKQEPAVELENQNVLPKALLDDMALEKQIHVTDPSCLLPVEQIHVVEHHDGDSLVPKSTIAHGLEELNRGQFKTKGHPSPPPKVISELTNSNSDEAEVSYVTHYAATKEGTDDPPIPDKVISEELSMKCDVETGDAALISSSTNVAKSNNSSSTETELRPTLTRNDPGSLTHNHMDLNDAYKLAIGFRMNQLSPRDSTDTELRQLRTTNSTETELRQMQTTSDPGSLMHNHMDLNDAYKLAIGYRMNQPSPRDSFRVHEDLKHLLSQMSAARGLELPWSDLTPSPRVHAQGDDLKMSDASSTTSQPNLYKRFSMERNESGFESLDGSIVSEIEGESPVDRLKRQFELDRKSMSLLYKELEEERSASAIAANQAMAMITRLQEEKAAMQMEALQYQRMMEEQAEYDQEVLQKSNNLLAQKEEEMRDLKAEIESYKRWLGNESSSATVKGDSLQEDNPIDRPLVKTSDDKKVLEQNDKVVLDAAGDKGVILKNSLLDFENEKLYISESLKRLEKKLHMFSNNGVYVDISEPHGREGVLCDHVLGNNHLYDNDIAGQNELKHGQIRENAFLQQRESSISGENSSTFTIKGSHNGVSTLPKFDDENQQSSTVNGTTYLITIENEVLHLNDRLGALEADRSFLEHTINSLRNGNDGIRFVEEIASYLSELRKMGLRRREQTPS